MHECSGELQWNFSQQYGVFWQFNVSIAERKVLIVACESFGVGLLWGMGCGVNVGLMWGMWCGGNVGGVV